MKISLSNTNSSYWSSLLSLLTSSSTLICCALPALLVALGAGAVLSSLITAVPQLVILSEYKEWVFSFAAVMLVSNGLWQWRHRNAPCPVGLSAAESLACARTRQWSWRIYWFSVVVLLIGVWFAFIQPWLSA
ncbi:MAG: hypothetical protein H0W44_00345 [Gammaproteobacteria bacterium]|nr:hypothetical protein [Gammaproteobacteria bacterium]